MAPFPSRCLKLRLVIPLIAALSSCSEDGSSLLSKLRAAIGSETEPNPDAARATPIGNQARLRAYIYPGGDADFYSFTGAAGDRVYIATMTSGSQSLGDTVVALLAADGTTVIELDDENGSLASTASSIAGTALPADGTYYVRVTGSTPTTEVRPYDLYFRRQTAPGVAEVEPNNTSATAQPFPASGVVDGSLSATTDLDFYSITLNAGDTIFLSLDLMPSRAPPAAAGRLGVGLFANTILMVNDPGTWDLIPSEALFMTVKTTGTYYLYVDIGGGTAIGNYRLSATVFPRDPAVCTTYTSTDVPKTIGPGPGQVTSVINVPGNPVVGDLTVSLGLTHTLPADLDLQLTAPAGNTAGLFTDVGSATFPNIDVTLDQSAATLVSSFPVINNMVVQPELAYRLDWFKGQPAGGNWTLTVFDDAPANGGTLNGFSLQICDLAPQTCPGGLAPTPLVSFDFETGASGFTHSGTADTWAVGTPTAAPITNCNSGTKCWKTNLAGNYSTSSTQDLVSPPIDLTTATAPVLLSWAMKYQMEAASYDHAWVEIQNADGTNPTPVWEWTDDTMEDSVGNPAVTVEEAAGWGIHTADVSAYAGRMVRLVFHLDADNVFDYAGLAIDDVMLSQCPVLACGNGLIEGGEQCDNGAANGRPGSCCTGTCQFAAPSVTCRASTDSCDPAETCTGTSGVCPANVVSPDGSACNDNNGCTRTDACQAGVCTGGNPVQCAPSDQCHVAGVCDPATGTCSNPAAPNGTTCSDGNGCTRTDTCQVGVCTGANPVTCTASDQCHVAGACDPATGTCSNPNANDGTSCSDGSACTRTDTCQGGTCTGGNPVQCTALDQCHPGVCDPATGTCSNPVAPDGTACSDGNGCTQPDTCQAGVCAGGNPVQCTASDQCHVAGICDPATGTCSNPAAPNGTTCSDGNACTRTDTCQVGVCTGANPVACTASDQCHVAGACDPATGTCSNPNANDGTSCSDGSACTRTDTCQGGTCTGGNPVQCTASDQCHPGVCDPATGTCSNPVAPDGTACSDGNGCTQSDTCQAGTCTAGDPVQCTASDQCHVAGVCDPATGTCSNPVAPDGTACGDGNACTTTDTCQSGTCAGGAAPNCNDNDECTNDTCNPSTGCVHDHIDAGLCGWHGLGASGGGCGCGATGGSELVALNLVGVLLMAGRRTRRKR